MQGEAHPSSVSTVEQQSPSLIDSSHPRTVKIRPPPTTDGTAPPRQAGAVHRLTP